MGRHRKYRVQRVRSFQKAVARYERKYTPPDLAGVVAESGVVQCRTMEDDMATKDLTLQPSNTPSTASEASTALHSTRTASTSSTSDYTDATTISTASRTDTIDLADKDAIKQSSKTYHLYHTGHRTENMSIHLVKDREIPLFQTQDSTRSDYLDTSLYKDWKPRNSLKLGSTSKSSGAKGLKYIRRSFTVDQEFDPRYQTSPYYMHNPHLAFRLPPRTLRRGGNKHAPPCCVMQSSSFLWRHWTFSFDERLETEDIFDGRGVLREHYGKKGTEGTLKGYRLRKFRYLEETGKKWFKQEKERLKSLPERPPATPFVPEETVRMSWHKPFSFKPRTYQFTYCGVDFSWRGTGTVYDKKLLGMTCGFNHLKLVASIPTDEVVKQTSKWGFRSAKPAAKEICLAKYTSLVSLRKAGRLEVFEDSVDRLFDEHLRLNLEKMDDEGVARRRKWLNDLIMASGLGMIVQEDQKRETLMELLELIADAAQNGG